MTQRSMTDSLYLIDNTSESTFMYDGQLPSLPVPTVQQSILKLLDTIKPIATNPRLFKETERKALEFLQDPNVDKLQKLLKQRASSEKNWLEAWWLEFAYLRSRKPLIPYSNMSAPLPIKNFWPVVKPGDPDFENVRARRVSISLYFQLCFWRMLRAERMRPMVHKGAPWSMNQFRYLFNTVRLPKEPMDQLVSWFKTANEGPPESTEIIVLHKGYVFALQVVTISGNDPVILLPSQIEQQIKYIENYCRDRPAGPGVGALTTQERTDWAEHMESLAKICVGNRRSLDRINRGLFVLVLDENQPANSNEIFQQSLCGDPRNRWADKSISSIAFKNGVFGANADHTPYDGFCTAIMTHYLLTSLEECGGIWRDNLAKPEDLICPKYLEELWQLNTKPELLEFKLNAQLSRQIDEAVAHFNSIANTIDSLKETFNHFGKAILKEHRLHPEAFVQCAIHSTYYRQHGRMAPTYVTASTRRFYNGRTETCRSCFPEMKDFAEFVATSDGSDPKQAYSLLKRSVDKFQMVMDEASKGQGCDRHLLGLYLTAMLKGDKIPELFDDELVQRTNSYILSTSCGGYWEACGGVPPLVEEGYGCFYSIEDNAMTFCCTAYKTCQETDLKTFYRNLEKTLIEMQTILLNPRL